MKQYPLLEIPEKKIFPEIEKIEIYHDEVQNNPFGHQFLIIPVRSKDTFNKILMNEREKHNATELTINWKEINKKTINRNIVAKRWLDCLHDAMYNKSFGYILDGEINQFGPLGIRIGSIFTKSIKELSDDYWTHIERNEEKTRKKYETLLRMGIQGVLHYCFNPQYTHYKRIKVEKFYTDGKVFGEVPLDTDRIIGKLEQNCRDYIEISQNINITPVLKQKVKTPELNFEELTDLVLGSTYYLCQDEKEEQREILVDSLARIYNKRKRRKEGFKGSRHFRTFTVTYCENKNGELYFENWHTGAFKNKFQEKLKF